MSAALSTVITAPRVRWLLLIAFALASLLLAACTAEERTDMASRDEAREEAAGDGDDVDAERGEAPAGGGADGDSLQVGGLGDVDEADPGRRLIREGSVTVGYPDTFDAAFREVVRLAQRLGGGALDVDSRTDDEGVTRGSVTVEVPVDDYDELLDGVGDVGPVTRREVRTEDVTDEYTDLESRKRHLERTEQFFLELFDEAETVDEAITIRDRLESVQERIEEIEGRLRRIDERTRMSRLTVELVPEGEEIHRRPSAVAGFGDYWSDARDAFVGVAGTILVVVVGGAPLAAVGAVALVMAMALVRAWRSTGRGETAEMGPANQSRPE